jgi:hypothetical protein
VPIDQWDAEAKGLCHANQSVIYRSIAVRVQLAHNFAGNSRRLYVTLIWAQTHFAHLVNNASLNWF